MWVYGIIFLVAAVWSDSGINQNTSATSNIYVARNETVNLGSAVNLTCSNKTWHEMIYIIWEINLSTKNCRISVAANGRSENSCNDGKSLQNTSRAQSYLHIPDFSADDEGLYRCESVYRAGSNNIKFNMSLTVPPSVSAWLEWQGNRRLAVCKAERGKPAATIAWRNMENSSFATTVDTQLGADGSYTVESRLELTDGMDTENLTCVIGHTYWESEKTVVLNATRGHHGSWIPLVISVIIIVIILVGFLFFARKTLVSFRRCWRSNTSPSESKSPPAEDVEEVEPYASYIQRVNSIYNSSVDLFK